MKMGMLSVNGLLEKCRLRTKWAKMAVCPKKFRRFGPGFTDKCSEKSLLSVNPHHNGQKFTDKSPENAGLSVKCVLLTDKSTKNGTLSVNLSEILDRSVEQYCRLKKVVFIHRKLKNRTKSVANRPPSFGFSFDSSKKRDFFTSLFQLFMRASS